VSEQKSILESYPDYECVIGIEVHVQLNTKTKIFCACPNQIVQTPNINICPICAGHPGVLPVLNQEVVNKAILAGLATQCTITPVNYFDRKHYFYPDLPKNYQITQNRDPICREGKITIRLEDGSKKNIRLNRIHMEEDAGKNIHAQGSNESFVDLNRAGTPLLEMVSYPDISSSYEARAYLKLLRAIVQYLGISTGNMQEGAFRADTNISVRKKGATKLGTKVELKNINSFKFIADAIEYEIERQISALEDGGTIKQETRLWDVKEGRTKPMRSKEEAADYRYFPEPDLSLIQIDAEKIAAIKATMPEMPDQKFERYISQHHLSPYEADILVYDADLANYYEQAFAIAKSKTVVNWILRDIMSLLKETDQTLQTIRVTPEKLAQLVHLVENGVINSHAAQEVFKIMAVTGQNPAEIVKEKGLEQIGSQQELEAIVEEIIRQNPSQVADYRAGKQKLFGFFVGQAMQKTQGKANPKMLQEILQRMLGKSS
jgi:aspartyl-tRNA(Asn)/glutamyl-tRNA(Gln) amidotransferase subunit B